MVIYTGVLCGCTHAVPMCMCVLTAFVQVCVWVYVYGHISTLHPCMCLCLCHVQVCCVDMIWRQINGSKPVTRVQFVGKVLILSSIKGGTELQARELTHEEWVWQGKCEGRRREEINEREKRDE